MKSIALFFFFFFLFLLHSGAAPSQRILQHTHSETFHQSTERRPINCYRRYRKVKETTTTTTLIYNTCDSDEFLPTYGTEAADRGRWRHGRRRAILANHRLRLPWKDYPVLSHTPSHTACFVRDFICWLWMAFVILWVSCGGAESRIKTCNGFLFVTLVKCSFAVFLMYASVIWSALFESWLRIW